MSDAARTEDAAAQQLALPRYIDPVGRRAALVTPDAVALDLPLADVGSRGLALAIDLVVMAVASWMLLAGLLFTVGLSLPEWVPITITIVAQLLVLWGYPILFEVTARGQTLGKMLLGLRVVAADGGPVTVRHAAIRAGFAVVDVYLAFGLLGLASMAVTSRVQRLGDLAAGTVVIRSRVGVRGEERAMAFPVPPHLQGYAQTLDVSGLDAEDYAILRGTLLRLPSMQAAPRAQAAGRIADAFATRLSVSRPPGLHPELLLLCLAGRMQQRDQGRDQRTPGQSPVWDPFSPATPSPALRPLG